MSLPPLQPDTMNWRPRQQPTRVATHERLQCERCGRVRYCSASCAHIHYWACHRHLCPIPDFSTNYNAEYIIRQGSKVMSFPARCVDTSPAGPNKYRAPSDWHARAILWTKVAHAGASAEDNNCRWCTIPLNATTAERQHNTWFIGLITCIRNCDPDKGEKALANGNTPSFGIPITIYESCPSYPGWPPRTWPAVHAHARFRRGPHIGRAYLSEGAAQQAPAPDE